MAQTTVEIKTTGIDHVVLWVSDLERSKRFYIDLLGMTVHQESDWQSFLRCGAASGSVPTERGRRSQDGVLNSITWPYAWSRRAMHRSRRAWNTKASR